MATVFHGMVAVQKRRSIKKGIVMLTVNMLQAKTSLSRLVEDIQQGRKREIIIARNGKPAARLVPLRRAVRGKRLGVAKGQFEVPADIDRHNDEVSALFRHGDAKP
jgi:antitoxin (DNA-binding transcriptional repressor) of toxin-antitoxin stability system